MNELEIVTSVVTMSSDDIAKLTGKEHSDVLRDIETIIAEVNSEGIIKTQLGYELNRDAALLLVSGYSASLRKKIIVRMDMSNIMIIKPS